MPLSDLTLTVCQLAMIGVLGWDLSRGRCPPSIPVSGITTVALSVMAAVFFVEEFYGTWAMTTSMSFLWAALFYQRWRSNV